VNTPDPLDRLPRETRRRLDAFSAKVDDLGIEVLPAFAARPLGPDHQNAVDNAERIATETGRQEVVAEARQIALDYIERRYAREGYRPGLGITAWPAMTSGRERANLAMSFAQAITAIVLADQLDEADVDELLGPWASLATQA
jgi:hypothetical protein